MDATESVSSSCVSSMASRKGTRDEYEDLGMLHLR